MSADRTHQERFLHAYARPNDIASEVVRIFRRDGLSMLSDDQLSELVQRLVDEEKGTRIRNRFNRQLARTAKGHEVGHEVESEAA
jgi:hypothetical protein